MAMDLLFDFEKLDSKNGKTLKRVEQYFGKAGWHVTSTDISGLKRSSGISFREVRFGFSDSQSVIFMIKQTGDIFKVKFNGRELPIKHQQDHEAAIAEMIAKLDGNRNKFQDQQTKTKVTLPPKMRSTLGSKAAQATAREAELDGQIAAAEEELTRLNGQLKEQHAA